MAPRANWQGYLKLSLVSCAVALYPASSTRERVSFNTINRKTGNKVKRIYVDPDTGEEVGAEDQVKGYAVAKNSFVLVEADELDAVKIESSQIIDIEKFVPKSEVDPRYLEAPYYIAPNDKVAQEAFAVIREAMRDAEMVGLGRAVIARRERVVMLEPLKRGLLGTVLRYDYEVRAEDSYFEDIPDVPLPDEMRDPRPCDHRPQARALRPRRVQGPLRGRAGGARANPSRRASRSSRTQPRPPATSSI